MGRFYRGYPWRAVITDLDTVPITMLDNLAAGRTIDFALNKPANTKAVVPSDDPRVNLPTVEGTGLGPPSLSFNDRLAYLFRREDGTDGVWVCRFAGVVEQIEDASSADQPYSTFTAYDPWQYLFARPIMSGTGLVGPHGLSYTATRGDVIAFDLVLNTIALHGGVHINLSDGVFEHTEQIDINFQQGTSVGAALQQLCATGTLDIVMEPIYDPTGHPGDCVIMNVYVQAGVTRDDAIFSWDVGRNVTGISSLIDGDLMANTVQFFNGQGGPPVAPAHDADSEARYGWWETQQFFPQQTQEVAVEEMAQFQLQLRKQGKRTIRLTPNSLLSPIPLLEYGLGDRVVPRATSRLRQPIPWASDDDEYSRVYGIPITLSDDGVEQVNGLVLSPDGS